MLNYGFFLQDCCVIFYLTLSKDKKLRLEFFFTKSPKFSIGYKRDENRLMLGIHLIFINLYINYSGLARYITKSDETREWSISIFNWAIWWCLGRPINSWDNHDWRHSTLNILSTLFGKEKHSRDNKSENKKTLILPEGEYQVDMLFEDYSTWRARIPKFLWKKTTRRVDLKINPEIPYPGKNHPWSGYSNISFPAKNIDEVTSYILSEVKEKRRGDIDYYNKPYRKFVDNFIYTIYGLNINIGKVPVELSHGDWVPIGVSDAYVADSTFKKLWDKDTLSSEEIGFINKYMGKNNSIDFIKDFSKEELQEEMRNYFKNRDQKAWCVYGSSISSI